MLAVSHHALIQWAAVKAGVITLRGWFSNYAVLGDDVVIACSRTAAAYRSIMESIGVQIGIAKSLLSPRGDALEFAKRFIYRGVDLSPVPLKEVLAAIQSISGLLELGRKHGLALKDLALIAGYGYRAVGGMNRSVTKMGRG